MPYSSPNLLPLLIEVLSQRVMAGHIGISDRTGHRYFHKQSEASSDLMVLLRFGEKPGKINTPSPIKPASTNLWVILDDLYNK